MHASVALINMPNIETDTAEYNRTTEENEEQKSTSTRGLLFLCYRTETKCPQKCHINFSNIRWSHLRCASVIAKEE